MGINQSGIRAKTAAEEVNRLRGWKCTEDRFEENKASIKKDCLAVLSGMSSFSWEKYSAALEAKGCFGGGPWIYDPERELCL